MPFDSLPQTKTKITFLELAAILRDESRWPDGFTWDFRRCETCAMGLAYQLYHGVALARFNGINSHRGLSYQPMGWAGIADAAMMSKGAFDTIFGHGYFGRSMPNHPSSITPEHIATAIEEWANTCH